MLYITFVYQLLGCCVCCNMKLAYMKLATGQTYGTVAVHEVAPFVAPWVRIIAITHVSVQ